MNHDQLAQLWIDGGGRADQADTAAAVALAESGGDPEAINDNPATGDYSVGLFQINYFGSLYWPRTMAYGPPSSLTDPARNVAAAIAISANGTNWRPWSTYKSGAYRQYLTGSTGGSVDITNAQLASSTTPAPSTSLAPGHSGITLWGLVTDPSQVAQALVRMGEVAAGGMFMGFGLVLVAYALVGKPIDRAARGALGVAGGPTGRVVRTITPAARQTRSTAKVNRATNAQRADVRAAEVQEREDRLRRRVENNDRRHMQSRTTKKVTSPAYQRVKLADGSYF